MKKLFFALCLLLSVERITALDTESGWNFALQTTLQEAFVPVVSVPVPYAQLSCCYTIPLDFGDSLVFSGANLAFAAVPILTPISFGSQYAVVFTPSQALSFTLGGTINTGWELLGNHGLGVYNFDDEKYEQVTPFTTWQYDFIFQTTFQFDTGVLIPGDWTHVVMQANYQILYRGCTAAGQGDFWEFTGTKDCVNGWKYNFMALLGYQLPFKNTIIGVQGLWSAYLDETVYGKYAKTFDGDFTDITLAFVAMAQLNEKNSIMFSVPFMGIRDFSEVEENAEAYFDKTTVGREWVLSNISLTWAYNF